MYFGIKIDRLCIVEYVHNRHEKLLRYLWIRNLLCGDYYYYTFF